MSDVFRYLSKAVQYGRLNALELFYLIVKRMK